MNVESLFGARRGRALASSHPSLPRVGDDLPPTQTETKEIPPARGWHLVVFHKDGVRAAPVATSRPFVVGRAPDCDVTVDAPLVSRAHFVIRHGSKPVLEDLRSVNGTRLNGRRIAAGVAVPVEAGSLIEAGGVLFIVQDHAPLELLSAPSRAPAEPRAAATPGVVVVDPAMVRLHDLIDLVARSTIPVLVVGETGVGKEVISAAVHLRSARADKPFVSLNCAALPEALLESELFGYEKGAFTGALQAKPGLIESAHEGTLFLDEVGEMPLATQAKLLRVLENGELLRLGALKPRRVDVRFIAATNRNLPQLVARETFRRDLYFRLNGITVPVPPLRERASEIAPLAQFFLAKAAKQAGRPCPSLSSEVLERLAAHSWPGNIRELRNVMERALTLCTEPSVRLEHVIVDPELPRTVEDTAASPASATKPAPASRRSGAPSSASPDNGRLLRMDEATERSLISRALDQCGGNQSKACEILGISRRTLISRLDEYGMKRPRKGKSA